MRFTITAALLSLVGASLPAEETWHEADSVLMDAQEKLAEVHEHADAAVAKEAEIMAEAHAAAEKTQAQLRAAQETLLAKESSIVAPVELADAEPTAVEASFMEMPDALAKLPGVKEDMERVREAERVYKEKMESLREKDDELMLMAKKNFADSKQIAGMAGHLRDTRKQPSSFFEAGKPAPPAFKRVLEAEEKLKQVNAELAKAFNLV